MPREIRMKLDAPPHAVHQLVDPYAPLDRPAVRTIEPAAPGERRCAACPRAITGRGKRYCLECSMRRRREAKAVYERSRVRRSPGTLERRALRSDGVPTAPDGIAEAAARARKYFGSNAAAVVDRWAAEDDIRWGLVAEEVRRQDHLQLNPGA